MSEELSDSNQADLSDYNLTRTTTYTTSDGPGIVIDMSNYYAQLDVLYGKDRVLIIYNRGPGDPPGNSWWTRKEAFKAGYVETEEAEGWCALDITKMGKK